VEYASKIVGIGKYIPEREISNDYVLNLMRDESAPYLSPDELKEVMSKAEDALEKAGNRIRHWCREDEYCTDIARMASVEALQDADLDPDEIDLIIFTGMSKALVEPATAHILQDELGASRANVIDTQDACSSFVKSLQIADSLIRSGSYRTILITCGERTYDWADFRCKTVDELDWKVGSLTIGDAAGTMIVQATEESLYRETPNHMHFTFKGAGENHAYCNIGLNYRIGDRYKLQSHSQKLLRSIFELITDGVEGIKQMDQKSINYDIVMVHEIGKIVPDFVIPLFKAAGFDIPNYRFIYPEFGNIASASLPVCLAVAKEEGRLKRGYTVAFGGGAAGTQIYGTTFIY